MISAEMKDYRIETDLVGDAAVPAGAYYGIHSMRARENFPITGTCIPPVMINSLAMIKKACALANLEAEVLPRETAEAIIAACDEILAGRLHDQFIVDPMQGGAGTSTNMNANEVIANRAIEILGGVPGDYHLVNPNDHVNCGQSTNDVYPTAIKLSLYQVTEGLLQKLDGLVEALERKAREFDRIVKMGRTQLQDAVPIRLGQEFSAYAAVMKRERERMSKAREGLLQVNLGGTAIGTGLNANPQFIRRVVRTLAEQTGIPFVQSRDLIDSTQNMDCYVALSSALKSGGISLSKICNDLRLMSSGPRTGMMEIHLPARQNGSSIMPGKVNPVIPEIVNQIAFRLIGFDMTVSMAAEGGQFELNAFEPVIFDTLYQGITQFTNGISTLTDHCIIGITADADQCGREVKSSIGIITALCPIIGYEKACHLAGEALRQNIPVRDLAVKKGILTEQEADSLLNPLPLTDWSGNGED